MLPALLPLGLLGGCAGYAADYWKPKENLVAPQLARYGLDAAQAQCVTARLKDSLSVWQLRQLGDLAGRATAGGDNPGTLTSAHLASVAGLVKDPKVGVETGKALAACSVPMTTAAGSAPAPVTTATAPVTTAAPAATATTATTVNATPVPSSTATTPAPAAAVPLWVNLGAAATGQTISVDAATLENAPGWRRGWFRLSDEGKPGPGSIAYRLRVDCVDKAITALAGRKYGENGAIAESRDYDKPEGPMAIEAGTVMEVAYRALCT